MKKSIIEKNCFFFVRHAETSWNSKKLCQGQKDIPLNKKGELQAKSFAIETQNINIECVISSPLNRALQTAKQIHHFHSNAEFQIVPEFSERNWGELEGISSNKMYAIEKLEEKNPLYSPGKNVEGRHKFRKRVIQGLLKAQKYARHPFIVSHGRVFVEICHILNIPFVRQLLNCQLVEIIPKDGYWKTHFTQRCCK